MFAESEGRRSAVLAGVLVLVALIAYSEYLALHRIFQVDELQNVFTTRLLAKHLDRQYSAYASLMFFGPMRWIAGSLDRSALIYRAERLLFFGLFWVNLALIVRCAGVRLRSGRGLLALLLVATLAPLWDFGFEIRHDNAMLTCVLLAWNAARPLREGAKRNLFLVGFVAAVAQFVAYKAFAYLLPIVVVGVVAALMEDRRSVIRTLVTVAAGVAAGIAASIGVNLLEGTWWLYMSSFEALAKSAAGYTRMSPAFTLTRGSQEAPLLVLTFLGAAAIGVQHLRERNWFSRDSFVPECALVGASFTALLANPTPYPYNLVLVVPQVAILALRLLPGAIALWGEGRVYKRALVCLFALHLLTWLYPSLRHLKMPASRQFLLMTTAEAMTDPNVHAVFDGSGLVVTRHPPAFHWLLHGFTLGFFRHGTWGYIRDQLAEGRTPIIIPNYRTVWLLPKDQKFMEDHYVPLAGDFWVAGKLLTAPGSASWDCIVPGRYFVLADPPGSVVRVDGGPALSGAVPFSRGVHTIDSTAQRMIVVWLGPYLKTPPAMGEGDAMRVLVNWY